MLRTTHTNPFGPNTTVLLPGTCNANCAFCFWNHEEGKLENRGFVDQVIDQFDDLPAEAIALSISGGEPTLSPHIAKFLGRLAQYRRQNPHRFHRVVLTTNGTGLKGRLLPLIVAAVDHVNISRHHYDEAQSHRIFEAKTLDDSELRKVIALLQSMSVDVTFNCVRPREAMTYQFCEEYMYWAQTMGTTQISFRTAADTIEPSDAERYFVGLYGRGQENGCPVCRGHNMQIGDYDIRWKGSVLEPSIDTEGVYEYIFHPDGQCYADWGMKHPINPRDVQGVIREKPVEHFGPKTHYQGKELFGKDVFDVPADMAGDPIGCGAGSPTSPVGCGSRSEPGLGCGIQPLASCGGGGCGSGSPITTTGCGSGGRC